MEGVDAISEVAEENNEFLKTDHSPRSLDFARNSTIDLSALNNKIVNMRSSVRQAKVRVIHKLTRNIEMLKKKKGSEKQLDKLKSKSERLLKEIKMIKGVNLDKVSKYALWNTSTLEDICKQPSSSIETRALTRLAECSIIQEKVKMFRSSHSDWKSLAAYLVMKQSGRRYKKKKNRDKKSSHAETTNIKTRHIMTDTYLQEKLDKNKMSSNCTENSELFCDRETEIEELVGDGCVVPEESVINISKKDMVSVENKKDKMNSNKLASLTNRLLKFFPDKTEDSDSSDCEANTISVHPKNKPADTAIENLNKDTVSEQSQIIVTDSVDCKTNDQLSSGKISTQMSNSGNKDYINQHNMERKKIAESSEKIENTESLCSESEDEETSEHSASEVSEYLNAEKNQNTNSLAEVKRQKGNRRTYGNKNELADTKSNKMTQLSYKDETNQDGKVKLTENKTDIVSSAEIEESEMSSEMSEQSEEEEDMSELCVRKQQMKNKASENEAKPWSVDTVSKEMVIKKLNLETFSSSAEGDILDIDETPPDFLISTEEVTHAKKRKKDPFFECSDDEEDDNDVNKSVVTEISGEVDDNDLSHLQHLQKARHAFKSDFVDKLGSKGYRRYDWSKNKMMQGDRMSTHRKSGSIARGGKRYENQNNKNYKGSERGFSDRDEDNTAKPWGKQKTFHKGGHDYSQSYELKTGVNKGQREFSKQSNNEVLHPSWEASKKRKQQVSIHAYQGKKIKFDD